MEEFRKKYIITWKPGYAIVKFNGYINMKDINMANADINGDERYYTNCLCTVWDFTQCDTHCIDLSDLRSAIAIDLGASETIKFHKLALIADDPHTIKLIEIYVANMKSYGSQWSFGIFDSISDAIDWADV